MHSGSRFHAVDRTLCAMPVPAPARQSAIHRKVRVRAQADRNSHTRFHQWFQSTSSLLAGWLDPSVLGVDTPRHSIAYICYTNNPTRRPHESKTDSADRAEDRADQEDATDRKSEEHTSELQSPCNL